MADLGFCCQGTSLDTAIMYKMVEDLGFFFSVIYSPLPAKQFEYLMNYSTNNVGTKSRIYDINSKRFTMNEDGTGFDFDGYGGEYYQIADASEAEETSMNKFAFDNVPWQYASTLVNSISKYSPGGKFINSNSPPERVLNLCDTGIDTTQYSFVPSISIPDKYEATYYAIPSAEIVVGSLIANAVNQNDHSVDLMINFYRSFNSDMMDGPLDFDNYLPRSSNNIVDNYLTSQIRKIGITVPAMNGRVQGHIYTVPGQCSGLFQVNAYHPDESSIDLYNWIKSVADDEILLTSDLTYSSMKQLGSNTILVMNDERQLAQWYSNVWGIYNPVEVLARQVVLCLEAWK